MQKGVLYSTGTNFTRNVLEGLSDLVRPIVGSKFFARSAKVEKKFTLDFFEASIKFAKKCLFFWGCKKWNSSAIPCLELHDIACVE